MGKLGSSIPSKFWYFEENCVFLYIETYTILGTKFDSFLGKKTFFPALRMGKGNESHVGNNFDFPSNISGRHLVADI